MSLEFYNSTNKSGIVDLVYSITQADTTKYPLKEVVRDVNLAMDEVWSIILQASGEWQLDDSNQTDYPIITTDLVAGQRDYSFTEDQHGNLILDIYKVMIKNPSGVFVDLIPVDQQRPYDQSRQNLMNGIPPSTMTDGQESTGTPTCYDKTANGIFLDLVPSYNSTGGLKVYINREPTYFTTSDTTKKPGFAGIFHKYLAYSAAYQYAFIKGLKNKDNLYAEMVRIKSEIEKYYGKRDKDVRKRLTVRIENTR